MVVRLKRSRFGTDESALFQSESEYQRIHKKSRVFQRFGTKIAIAYREELNHLTPNFSIMKTAINVLWIVLIALAPLMGSAQSTEYKLDESSTLIITGTSTIHDWEADVEEMDLSVSLNPALLNGEHPETPVSSLILKIPVKSIESGKGGMNRKIYGALKQKDHPYITFELVTAELADSLAGDDRFKLKVNGDLSIAEVSRRVSFEVTGIKTGNDSYHFKGNYSLNMKDYNVDPPSAMLGTIRSGEEVEIEFDILLTANQS